MATLNDKTTNGTLNVEKYVVKNNRLKKIDFSIDDKQETALFKKKGNKLEASTKLFKGKTKLKIIEQKVYNFGASQFVMVKIGSLSGLIPINKIKIPTIGNGTQYEDEVVDLINDVIVKNGGSINIKLKGDSVIYKDILYAVKVDLKIKRMGGAKKGDPKADIILCKDIKKPIDKTSIYVSHKKEGGPEAFQQYGGLSEAAGLDIFNHRKVQNFLKLVSSHITENKLESPVMALFTDKDLSSKSIFGPDFGKAYSLDHTQIIGQGKPKLTSRNNGKYFELDFSSHMSLSGDLGHFKGGYEPVLGATYRAGRGFNFQGKRYVGARVGIYPRKLIETRTDLIVYNL